MEQIHAINMALSNAITLIQGGPGSGKTFLTTYLVKAFMVGPSSRIILAAPTGKAASRLKEFNPEAVCGTLHSILNITSSRCWAKGRSYLEADLIIVDESSMIDARLFAFFLASLQEGQRVVFLGDKNQLPPVEAGAPFIDLVGLIPTAYLQQCLRWDRKKVVQLAQQILEKKPILPDSEISEALILRFAEKHYPSPTPAGKTPFFHKQSVILSSLNEGTFGVNRLNDRIFHFFYSKMRPDDQLAIPILITKTLKMEDGTQFYSGEMGVLWRTQEKILDAYFFDGNEKKIRKVPFFNLPPYQLGYVLSVHMSQGSEFETVLLIVSPGSERFGRQLLYTGVTRGKREVIVCGDVDVIQNTIKKANRRTSGLKARWKEEGSIPK